MGWEMEVQGWSQYKLVKKLQALKSPLRTLNSTHFSHISTRAENDMSELIELQQMLHDSSKDEELQRKELLGRESQTSVIDPQIITNGIILNRSQGEQMITLVSDEEIKAALFNIGDLKSPSPDGYSACFFKRAWRMVGKDVSLAIKEFFESRKLLKQLNHTVIALIPKSNHVVIVQEYRPIACCNVIYKTIAKILAERIKPCLEELVCLAQSAFVKQKSMIKNICLVQEIVRKYARKRVSLRCLLKIDLKKAYDSISWKFVKDMLVHLNFSRTMVGWIMQCVSTSFSLSLNGGYHGMRANNMKSNILFAGIKDIELEKIRRVTNFQDGDFPFRYLGILLAASRLNKVHYSPLINRIADLLSGWPKHTISYAGRMELINSVIQGIECFYLTIFPIPKSVMDHVVRLCRTFLWGDRRKPPVA
ncbi:uncharacterized protein LOC131146240 [Malania oleifera]|uniref:uncharacterized protein LOC131146240 n=1 Tax=Malania oleifera TaxID=397392 RepID=UPI0025AE5988|nr:uncharacterized protein LOC131146240 [Malania oleifera]